MRVWFQRISASLILIIVIGYLGFQMAGRRAQRLVENRHWTPQAPSDGVYRGEYRAFGFFSAARVSFSIRDHEVAAVSVDGLLATPGHEGADRIKESFLSNKSLQVDAVSGASYSAAFLQAAVYDALDHPDLCENKE